MSPAQTFERRWKREKERERCAEGLAVRSFPVVRRPSFSQEHREHCKVITVSFAIGPLVKHYGHKSLTASAQHNGHQSWTFYVPFTEQMLETCPHVVKVKINVIQQEVYV